MENVLIKKYPSYKPSGIEWLGEIPEHWEIKRLKYVFRILKRIAGELGHSVLSITQNGIKIKDIDSGEGQLSMDYSKYQYVYSGDFAMNHMDLLTGYVDISKFDGVISPDYRVFELVEINSNKNYMLILLQLGYKSRIFYAHGQGVSMLGRWRFPSENFNNFSFPIPPIQEQIAIAEFLDRKTALIDQAVGIKEKQIELLKERRQILIQNAVTKGLDKNARMKDSGVEWIGEIPEGWEVESFKNILIERNQKNIPIISKERLSLSIDKGVTLYSEKTTNLDRFKEDFTQYKLAHKGDLVFNSMNMIVGAVGVSDYFGCVSPVYYTYFEKTGDILVTKFYEYFFKNKKVQSVLYSLGKGIMAIDRGEGKFNTVRLKVSRSDLRSMQIPRPKTSEIYNIIEYIESTKGKIDKVIALQEQQIEKLKEYKASLINEVVTGKIKVN
jgi:type I restriction enzyme S subunit